MKERLQKILARAGYGSRRSCEELISAGRVRVYGQVTGLGDKADAAQDQITVDGRPVKGAEELVYVALYKPRGVISTVTDPTLRPAVTRPSACGRHTLPGRPPGLRLRRSNPDDQ